MGQRPPDAKPKWTRYGGIGVEFAAAVAGFGLAGYWIDRHYETHPWGVIIGAALGLVGGTYNLIRESMAAFRAADRDARESRDQDDQD